MILPVRLLRSKRYCKTIVGVSRQRRAKEVRCLPNFFSFPLIPIRLYFLLSPLGRVDFTSKASKRRERSYFCINLDKFLFLDDLYRLGFASLSEPLSPRSVPLLSLRDIFPVSSGTFTPQQRTEWLYGRTYSNLRVCSPVEAGEVARKACRRGGDLPRGVRLLLFGD